MITVTKQGQFIIPKEEGFIGYAGDNLNATKEFFIEQVTDISLIYRMYLQFDDGTCNYFLLESEVQDGGTLLTWNITNDQIFKSGIVQLQIKASNDSGEVFHSRTTTMLVQSSIEFTDFFCEKENSEFLRYESELNNLTRQLADTRKDVETAIEQAQILLDNITEADFDTEPTENSSNAVTSGGVYNALSSKISTQQGITITSKSQLDAYTEPDVITRVGLINITLDSVESFYGAAITYMIGYGQILQLENGKIFARNINSGTDFVQVGFTKEDIISLIQANK